MDEHARQPAMRDHRARRLPARIFLSSQAEKPGEIRRALLDSAVSDGWISLLVNVNTAIFAGLIALTADFGALESLVFLGMQLSFTFIGMVTLLFLQIRRQSDRTVGPRLSEGLLTFTDILLMVGWGFGVLLFASPLEYERSLLVIVLITTAGIAGSALNARLLPALIVGRIILFAPSFFYFAQEQPPFWGLLLCTIIFAMAVSIGIGYAIHVQHLNEANLGVKLRETSVLLEQQSFSLERSMILEHQAQQKLLRETKLRERFLHSISHDLNQPLSALALYLKGLGAMKLSDAASGAVDAARQCLASARSLIRGVSQIAWITDNLPPARLEPVELGPVLKNAAGEVAPLAAEKSLSFQVVPSSLTVYADADFLKRVIRNLLHNAVQYTKSGGIVLGVRRHGDHAEIVVADTGTGISEEDQQHVFEAFYQARRNAGGETPNVGLGLSIVSSLVGAMNGEVRISSREGSGSVFGVVLPLAWNPGIPAPADSSSQEYERVNDPQVNGSVLLAEDNPDYLASVGAMLRGLGYAVETAHSTAEIAAIDADSLADKDFVILDFDLGNGVTAFDIIARTGAPDMPPCLVISLYDDPNMIFQIKELGGRFLKKPFDRAALETTLKVLAKSRS
jgi:signal transduction histidine kinase